MEKLMRQIDRGEWVTTLIVGSFAGAILAALVAWLLQL